MKNEQNKPYTSQVAETHIDSIINERYKRVRKCNGLVKEPIMYYKLEERLLAMDKDWQSPVLSALVGAA